MRKLFVVTIVCSMLLTFWGCKTAEEKVTHFIELFDLPSAGMYSFRHTQWDRIGIAGTIMLSEPVGGRVLVAMWSRKNGQIVNARIRRVDLQDAHMTFAWEAAS